MKTIILVLTISSLALSAYATKPSPYSGQEARPIKALSEKEIEGYLNGGGMGYAKAAELNQYPGPRHVLDLAKELSLTGQQIEKTEAIFDAMKIKAVDYGKKLVDKEQELDQHFASNSIEPNTLEKLLEDIADLQSKIRYVHLAAHIEQKAILSRHQIMQYDQLRGYGSKDHSGHGHHH